MATSKTAIGSVWMIYRREKSLQFTNLLSRLRFRGRYAVNSLITCWASGLIGILFRSAEEDSPKLLRAVFVKTTVQIGDCRKDEQAPDEMYTRSEDDSGNTEYGE